MANPRGENYQLTMPARIFHPNLLEAKRAKRNGTEVGDPKFSINLALSLDHPDLMPMKRLVAKLATDKWPNWRNVTPKPVFPFTKGDALADKAKAAVDAGKAGARLLEFNRGYEIIPCRSKYQPAMACFLNGVPTDLNTDELKKLHASKFFFGAEAIVVINFLAYDKIDERGFDGVTARLNSIAVTGKGERIGGRRAAGLLGSVHGQSTMENPLADNADPF